MRDDQKFEIERAFDLLPHVVGASWTTIWFRFIGQKHPSRDEFRGKVIEYLNMLTPIYDVFQNDERLSEISAYIKKRKDEEIKKVASGQNNEIEKRYDRYVDYG